ncbi:Methylenetetrahydrofolate reductase [uncultured archaeon]|nr:Methylenetetrahydrofolate reductase [uncultured archaeon]
MKIKDILSNKKFTLSFEVFPPKIEGDFEKLIKAVIELKRFNPDWVSVTYGAGGNTKNKSITIASVLKEFYNLEVLAHLTCTNSSKKDIKDVLYEMERKGIENILALRGDPPRGKKFEAIQDGFAYASELVSFIKKNNGFCMGGACYPQGHIESSSLENDMDNLKKKVDAGAEFLITQLFFENNKFYNFVDRAEKAGITIPINPGIMPITNYHQIKRMTELTGNEIPFKLKRELETRVSQPEEIEKLGRHYAAMQAEDLKKNGARGIHFYCMNRSAIVAGILEMMGYQ